MGLVSSKKRRGDATKQYEYGAPFHNVTCIRANPFCRGFVFGFGHYVTGVFQPFLEYGMLNEGFG